MNRSLKLSVMVALALGSAPALALDLGQIQVKSALDRPLVAEIPVHPDYPGEADHLKVTLAPAAAFARAGISRSALKVPLTFTVVTHADGQKFIRITSAQPVREPFLDFLVQVSWPKGKMLREYTVLLDPLSMGPALGSAPVKAAAPAAAPATQSTVPAPAAVAKTPAPAPQAAPMAPAPNNQGSVYGPVQHGDTLSHIARANAMSGVSYQQMLIALKTTNPDAFFNDNVNDLKAGAILRIPTRQQAMSVSRQAAMAAVHQQNVAWRGRHAIKPTMVASAGGSSDAVNGLSAAAGGNDSLHLVPPKAGSGSASGNGGQATVSQLRQDLARSNEALLSQKQSAADLKTRVTALEHIADKNKRLLGLKNAQVAELQQKLAQARKVAGMPALPASAQVTAASGLAAAASTAVMTPVATASVRAPATVTSVGQAAVVAVASTAAATVPVKQQVAQKAPPATQTNTPHTATVSAPWYEQLWARVVLIVIIVLLLIWMVLGRRKASHKPAKRSVADQFGDSPLGHGAADDTEVADDNDDVDLAQDDDGEDELLAQLAGHPDNIGLHLELVSLYYARRDAGSFEGAAEAMHAYVEDEDEPEWQEVLSMGRDLVPDHPLFDAYESQPETAADEFTQADFGEQDFARAEDGLEHEAPLSEESSAPVSDEDVTEVRNDGYHFDFNLTPDSADHSDTANAVEGASDGLPDESEFDALPPLSSEDDSHASTGHVEETPAPSMPDEHAIGLTDIPGADEPAADAGGFGFSDNPVDTKLDLARAYMDMGDHDGARAMLNEAMQEGSQVQKDAARKLLDELG